MARNSKKPAKKPARAKPRSKKLAATVKADATTVILGDNPGSRGTVPSTGLPGYGRVGMRRRLSSGFSHVAQRMLPKKVQPVPLGGGFAYDRKANRKIKKIARQLAKQAPQVKRRRSRLPLVVGLLLGVFGFGAYYTYTAIPWGSMADTVSEYTDVRDWLAKTSGDKRPTGKDSITRPANKQKIVKRTVKRRVVKKVVRKPSTVKRSTAKRSYVKKSPTKTTRRVVKKMSPAQYKIYMQKKKAAAKRGKWQRSVAKIENGKKKNIRNVRYNRRR